MSTTAISNLSIFQEIQSFYQDRRTDLRQLGRALQAGDLNRAQQAYDALVALGQGGPFRTSDPFSRTDRASAFEALGQALQSGDVVGAQAAFAGLQETFGRRHGALQNLPAFTVNLSGAGGAQGVSEPESIFQQLQDFRTQRKTGLQQLGQALQSGDADAAQQAFDALVALGQNGPFRTSTPFRRADREQAFEAIGQALQNGDLTAAQHAFTALADTFGHHAAQVGFSTPPPIIINVFGNPLPPDSGGDTPPPVPVPVPPPSTTGGPVGPPEIFINVGGSTAPADDAPEIIVNLGNGSGAPEEVTINVGGSGSGGQITIDVNQGRSDNAHDEISINVNLARLNYQLVLNLFDTVLNSPAQGSPLSLNA